MTGQKTRPIRIDGAMLKDGLRPIRTRTGKKTHLLDPRCLDVGYPYPNHPLCGGGMQRHNFKWNSVKAIPIHDDLWITCSRCIKIHALNQREGRSFEDGRDKRKGVASQRLKMEPATDLDIPHELRILLQGRIVLDMIQGEHQLVESVVFLTGKTLLFCRERLGDWTIQKEVDFHQLLSLEGRPGASLIRIETMSGRLEIRAVDGDVQRFIDRVDWVKSTLLSDRKAGVPKDVNRPSPPSSSRSRKDENTILIFSLAVLLMLALAIGTALWIG